MPIAPGTLATALAAILLAGCAQTLSYTLVETRRVPIGDAYTVEPQITWTSVAQDKVESWTVDGFALHYLRFFKGIANGEPLLAGGKDEAKRPHFRSTMTESEIAEFIVDSFYGGRLRPRELRPATFGGAPALRFDLTYVTGDGIQRRAAVVGAVLKEKLHVIVYDGAALRYFPRYRDHVERLLESIQLR
ncbi:MAG TPA: hypothetical protein VGV13_14650 [Methylomirabilota bacterium]|jgi:hypothetical protein|nr:hypothetical protein [Methylomirabilota bacterium]